MGIIKNILNLTLLFLIVNPFISNSEIHGHYEFKMAGLVGCGILLYGYKHNNRLKEYVHNKFEDIKKLSQNQTIKKNKKKILVGGSLLAIGLLAVLYHFKQDNINKIDLDNISLKDSCSSQNFLNSDIATEKKDNHLLLTTGILKPSGLVAGRRHNKQRQDIRQVQFKTDF